MTRCPRWSLLLRTLLGCLVVLQVDVASADEVLAAADGRHVFVARPGVDESGWEIVHIDAEVGPSQYRTIFRTPRRPAAMSAVGDRCLLVLGPYDATLPSPLAIVLRVVRHPLNGAWFADPPGDPEILPPLPPGGELAGVVAVGDADVLVHGPSQRVARGITRTDRGDRATDADVDVNSPNAGVDEDGAVHRLGAWSRSAWERVDSPAGLATALELVCGRCALVGRVKAGLVWRAAIGGPVLSVLDDRSWRTLAIEGLPEGALVSLATLGSRSLLTIRDETGDLLLFDLLPGGTESAVQARRFTRIAKDVASPMSTVVATSGGAWVIGLDGAAIRIVTVDRGDGSPATPVVPEEQDVAGSLVEYPIYLVLVMAIMLGTFLLRPHIERQPATPVEGLVPAGLLRRAAGLCIDLAPGLMIAVLVFDLDPEVFAEDLRSGAVTAMAPAMVAIISTSVLTMVLEATTDRSLGKWVVGTRVAALDGRRGTVWQRGLRAALRLVVLLFWPLAMVVLLDPAGRGLPELLTRTIVLAGRRPEAPPPGIDLEG